MDVGSIRKDILTGPGENDTIALQKDYQCSGYMSCQSTRKTIGRDGAKQVTGANGAGWMLTVVRCALTVGRISQIYAIAYMGTTGQHASSASCQA